MCVFAGFCVLTIDSLYFFLEEQKKEQKTVRWGERNAFLEEISCPSESFLCFISVLFLLQQKMSMAYGGASKRNKSSHKKGGREGERKIKANIRKVYKMILSLSCFVTLVIF